MISTRPLLIPFACLVAACQSGPAPGGRAEGAVAEVAAPAVAWRSSPGADLEINGGAPTRVRTGPHAVVWEQGEVLRPPYRLEATLRKREGRLHEGYGLLFGGSNLDGPEAEQHYSYFLVRGDGSFLIKRRDGSAIPVVRPWTAHPSVPRDTDAGGGPVQLEVEVGEAEAIFRAGGAEVARIPAAELDTEGYPGLRVSHDLDLAVDGWRVERIVAGGGA